MTQALPAEPNIVLIFNQIIAQLKQTQHRRRLGRETVIERNRIDKEASS